MSDAFQCTKETPWSSDKGTPVEHDAVEEVGDQQDGWPGGDIVTKRCKNCGHKWTQELPQ